MDIKIPIACLLIAGGAIGLGMSVFGGDDRLDRVYTQPASLAANSAETSSSTWDRPQTQLSNVQDTSTGWALEEVVLDREADGHFYANVRIDGMTYRMLVDTGASVVALTGSDASAMGIYWDDMDVRPIAQGAGGAVEGVGATITRMNVGDHEAQDVRAMIIPDGLQISLLGQSYLSTLSKVEITGDRMVLGS